MIKKNNKKLDTVFKGSTEIAKIYKGTTLLFQNYYDKVVSGINSIALNKAKANSLNYLKAFGKCEQTGTPTPSTPISIWCNNGELKVRNKSGLPLGYQRVESVTNTAQTRIDTGVKFNFSKNYEIELRARAVVGTWYLLQARAATSLPISGISGSQNGNRIALNVNGESAATSQIFRVDGNIYYVKGIINNGNLTLYVKDETAGTDETVTGTYTVTTGQSANIYLFGNLAQQYVGINTGIYFARIKEDDNYILNYVPCRQNTTAGFYDLASNTFKTATDLSAGADVDDMEIYADGTPETVEVDTTGDTATAENLLSVDSYKDVQEVISGSITRKIGIKVLDGSENWSEQTASTYLYWSLLKTNLGTNSDVLPKGTSAVLCTHYPIVTSTSQASTNTIIVGASYVNFITRNIYSTLADWKAYLQQQYANGTPVIVVYPLATPTTENVTAQPMNIQKGNNIIEIKQASINQLDLEAKYKGK